MSYGNPSNPVLYRIVLEDAETHRIKSYSLYSGYNQYNNIFRRLTQRKKIVRNISAYSTSTQKFLGERNAKRLLRDNLVWVQQRLIRR